MNKCWHRKVLSKRQVRMSIFHIINLKKKKCSWTQGSWIFVNKQLTLDYYFCLKSGPVFLFQIQIFLEDKHSILLHLSIFYKFQQFFQHRICFPITNETSHVTTHATHIDPWPTLAHSTSLFLICCYKKTQLEQHVLLFCLFL